MSYLETAAQFYSEVRTNTARSVCVAFKAVPCSARTSNSCQMEMNYGCGATVHPLNSLKPQGNSVGVGGGRSIAVAYFPAVPVP